MIPISKPFIGEAEKQNVMAVLESGLLVQGEMVDTLEEKFAELCQVKHAIATSSGTTALQLAMYAHNIGPGDEVITTSFTFMASVSCIIHAGAKPVLVDIDEQTFNIDLNQVEAAITPKTKAILPVHLYGYPCNMDALTAIAERHSLILIEDAAQAVGATFKGQPTGSFGTGCFSLYATKNITSGEGGIVTTNDNGLAYKLRMLRQHGMEKRYYHEILGYNFRMTNLHAAIGVAQMDRLDTFVAKRRQNATYYNTHIARVIVPTVEPDYGHVWHQYTVKVPSEATFSRDQAIQTLTDNGIGTAIYYPVPVHQQVPIRKRLGEQTLPVTEKLAKQVFSIPVHLHLSKPEIEKIVRVINSL